MICYSNDMSLIPDKPLVFSPHIAATLGLEEAILLQTLKETLVYRESVKRGELIWAEIPGPRLLALLPFWDSKDIWRITSNLLGQGVLLTDNPPFDGHIAFRFAFNEPTASGTLQAAQVDPIPTSSMPVAPTPATTSRTHRGINLISARWEPDGEILGQLAQYGIPQQFALDQVGEFVTYWGERAESRHSWGSKFIKQVLKLWREREAQQARLDQEVTIDSYWRPSPEALEILIRADINGNFIEDAIPEFILYWRDRGTRSSTWNTQFVQHIRRQWAKYHSSLSGQSNEPHAMGTAWRPDENVYDILDMAGIERGFAEQCIPEFVLYWQESGQLLNSWNTKFLQYVKRQWAYQNSSGHNNSSGSRHATQQKNSRTGSTRHRNLVEELSDRSWAG